MQAMLLAAGLGTRLKPITDLLPKPLFPVLNAPCLKRHIINLIASGFKKIIINSYHLSHLIEKSLKEWNFKDIEIILLKEKELLGTGGGIRNALPHIDRKEPLIVINSDIITDINLRDALKMHIERGYNISMLTHYSEKHRALRVEDNTIKEFGYNEKDAMSYTGICVLNSFFIETIPNKTFCLIKAFNNFIRQNGIINAIEITCLKKNYLWEDIGTPETYLDIHKRMLEMKKIKILCDETTVLPKDIKIEGWCCFGKNVSIGKNAHIKNSVIWDNAIIPDNADINNEILYKTGHKKAI